MMSTRRLQYLEPPPRPEPTEWRLLGRVLLAAWLSAHAFVDVAALVRWFAE
jgi:hypothetical protein